MPIEQNNIPAVIWNYPSQTLVWGPPIWSLTSLFEVFHSSSTNGSSAYSFQPYMNFSLRGILVNTMFSNTWVLHWCCDWCLSWVFRCLVLQSSSESTIGQGVRKWALMHSMWKLAQYLVEVGGGEAGLGEVEGPGMMWNHFQSLDGNPLQYSCLENPRDREAWWAAIYGVAQSQTRLKWLSSSSSSSRYPKVQIRPVCLAQWVLKIELAFKNLVILFKNPNF